MDKAQGAITTIVARTAYATDIRRACDSEDNASDGYEDAGFSVDSIAVDTVYLYRGTRQDESCSLSSSLV